MRTLLGLTRFLISGALLLAGILVLLFVLTIVRLLLVPIFPKRAARAKRGFASMYYFCFVLVAEWITGSELVFSGDLVPSGESVLLISNHIGFFDWAYLFMLAARKQRLGFCRIFAKSEISNYGPWGWCMSLLGFIWVNRDWTDDRGKIQEVFKELWNFPEMPIWVMSFLEGRRFTLKRHQDAIAFAEERGLPKLENVLYPRVKGFRATMSSLRPLVDAVYDVTLGFPDTKCTGLLEFLTGEHPKRIHLHVRRFPIQQIPLSNKEIEQWVYEKWSEKDQLLDHFYKNGEFPGPKLHEPCPFGFLFSNALHAFKDERPIRTLQ